MCGPWDWWAQARMRRTMRTTQDALTMLRASAATISGSIAHHRRRIRDFDAAILTIGIAWRKSGSLSGAEKMAFANELRRKRLHAKRIERQYGLLATVEEQIALLEDAHMTRESLAALQHGAHAADAHMMKPADVESLLERVAEQQALAADTEELMKDQLAVAESMQGLDDAALEEELAHLMESDGFISQFDAEDVARVKHAVGPPPPPPDPLVQITEERIRRDRDRMGLSELL